jgi:site-specific recombinase XerD
MLRSEAIRLVSQPEQDHEALNSRDFAAASTGTSLADHGAIAENARVEHLCVEAVTEDMRLRKLAPHTQDSYIRSVRRLAGYLHRSPDTATTEELRNFQLHLVDRGTSPITLNATITGLKFFFEVTLEQKVDIRVIQMLLGHKKIETTSLYTHVATEILRQVIGPLEPSPAPGIAQMQKIDGSAKRR